MLLLYPSVLHLGGTQWPVNLGACLGALVLAHLMHRFVEQPTQASRWGTSTWLVAGAALSAATVVLAMTAWLTLPPGVGTGRAVTTAPAGNLTQVQNAVRTSLATEAVPRNLSPDVWHAPDDQPVTRTSPEDCMADYRVVEQGPCVYGDPRAGRTVVLFGDSHMEQWQPAFDRAGRSGGWKVVSLTKSSYPLPDRPVQQQNEQSHEYVECERWRSATLERIAELRPDLVVMSQSDEISQEASTPAQYADGTVATVDHLRRAGLKVTYVLDNPHPDANVPACLSEHLDDARACTGRADVSHATKRRDLLRRALLTDGITTVDPAPWACWSGRCPPVVDNMLIYRDDNHFTATYSRWLAPMASGVLSGSGARG